MDFYRIRRIWNPEIFQGHNKKNSYFEGWYYKLVDEEEKNVYAFIPGISIVKQNNLSHAFIQIINGNTGDSQYFKFNINEFDYSMKNFEINIGENYFSLNNMVLNIEDKGFATKGEINFEGITPWPVKLLSPGVMGWYTFIPFMECYHSILSLTHSIKGCLEINNSIINFDNGIGYMEKDWGASFPSSWIWIQSNHFDKEKTSLTASIATIPWLTGNFTGFIIGLLYEGKLYRFTTYTGAKLRKVSIKDDKLFIEVKDKNYSLRIQVIKGKTGILHSPKAGVMKGKIYESLKSQVKILLYMEKGNKKQLIYEGWGRNAGLEITNAHQLIKSP